MRVLLHHYSYGGGHTVAVRAVEEALKERSAEYITMDGVRDESSQLHRALSGGYVWSMRRGRAIWKGVYRMGSFRASVHLANRIVGGEPARILRAEPDVIAVFHILSLIAGMAVKRKRPRVRLVCIPTDIEYHPHFLSPMVDLYCVASAAVRDAMAGQEIAPSRIVLTGIPVKRAVREAPSREDARNSLGIAPEERVVLMVSGEFGSGKNSGVFRRLSPDTYVLFVAGRNDRERRRAERLVSSGRRGRVYGYTEELPTLMAASDIVVTKPGGLTTAEMLAIGAPSVLTGVIPGHEERNAHHLVECGAAVRAGSKREAAELVEKLLSAPEKLARMHRAAKTAAIPDAAQRVANRLTGVAQAA